MAKIHLNDGSYFSTTGKSNAFAVVIILSHAISPNPIARLVKEIGTKAIEYKVCVELERTLHFYLRLDFKKSENSKILNMAFSCQTGSKIRKVLICSQNTSILSPDCHNKPVEKKKGCTSNYICSQSTFRKTKPKEKSET